VTSRHDIVLAALPALAVSGIVVQYLNSLFTAVLGIHVGLPELPLVLAGLSAAVLVVCHEVFIQPPVEHY